MQARARPWWHGRVLHRGWNRTDMGGCAGMAEAVLTWPAVLAWADPRRHDRLCWCGRGPHWHDQNDRTTRRAGAQAQPRSTGFGGSRARVALLQYKGFMNVLLRIRTRTRRYALRLFRGLATRPG